MSSTKFIHYRFYPEGHPPTNGFKNHMVSASSGASIAYKEIDGDNGRQPTIAVGIAWCNPKDNFSRKMGRTVAEGRLSKYVENIFALLPEYTFENTLLIDRGNKDQHVEERVREFFKDEMQDRYYF